MMKIKIDKHNHIEPGKQIKIVLARCKAVSEKQGYTELSKVYTITERPNRNAKRNGDSGVWVETKHHPIFVWFFEFVPYFASKATSKSTEIIEFTRTKFPFIRTK